jgi:hypothetical protein
MVSARKKNCVFDTKLPVVVLDLNPIFSRILDPAPLLFYQTEDWKYFLKAI